MFSSINVNDIEVEEASASARGARDQDEPCEETKDSKRPRRMGVGNGTSSNGGGPEFVQVTCTTVSGWLPERGLEVIRETDNANGVDAATWAIEANVSCEQAHRTIALCRSLGQGTFAPMGLAGAMYRSLEGRKHGGPHGVAIFAEAKLEGAWPNDSTS